MKGLLRRISHHHRVGSLRRTCRILISTGSGNLIFRLLGRGEVISLLHGGMYKEEGERSYRLGAPVNCLSRWSSKLFLRTYWREYDTITLWILQASISGSYCLALAGFPKTSHFTALERWEGGGIGLPVRSHGVDEDGRLLLGGILWWVSICCFSIGAR